MKELIQSEWFVVSSYVIGVLSLVISIIFYKKSKNEKKPCCINRTRNIIHDSKSIIKDLEITAKYKGAAISSLSYTKVAFWNAGKGTIKSKDIPKNDPVKIEVDGEEIYECEIIYEAQKANNFQIEWRKNENSIYFNFDYLDFGQGAIIKIIHSGNSMSYKSNVIKVKGSIKGATKIENPHPSFAPTNFLTDSQIFYEDNILV